MGTDRRQRKKANRAARLELEQREARRRGLVRRLVFLAVVVVGVLGLALLFNLLAGDDPEPLDTGGTVDGTEEGSEPGDPATEGDTGTEGEQGAGGDAGTEGEQDAGGDTGAGGEQGATALPRPPAEGECPPADGSGERVLQFDQAPPLCIDPSRSYTATVRTNLGEFVIDLDPGAAPATVNNFVFLARHQFYDGVAFHRIVPGFVVQGGDATGDPPGTGGPGYEFADELPEAGEYQIGSVAMANSGPNTNGSQFFVVTGEDGVALPPQYSLFGQVSEGMDVVMAIEATVDPETGQASEEAVIEDVTITEG